MKDYCKLGWQYAEEVVAGKIPNGQWAIKACERSLRDRANQETEAFPYVFDNKKAIKVCSFIEELPHIKGDLAGQLIKLEPWQCWMVGQIFGWQHSTGFRKGKRRFRHAYIEVGRGNAKSTIMSAIGLYMLAADGGGGNEVYSIATTRDQAKAVWMPARAMARSPVCAEFMELLGIETYELSIMVKRTNSMFIPASADASTLDGLNIACAVVDECHAHKTRDLWDVTVTGCGKRSESLMLAITTAGTNRAGICYEQHTYLRKLLDQVDHDEKQFGCIWSADEDDDFRDPKAWQKANPNFGISVDPDYLEGQAAKASIMPAAQNNFRTKHLCQWVSASTAWMDMRIWDACGNTNLKLKDFEGKECFIGMDLAYVSDIAAKAYIFPEQIDDETHFTVFVKSYLSQVAIEDGRNSQYEGWKIEGYIIETAGDVTDFGQIEEELEEDLRLFNVKELAFDPFQALPMMQSLAKKTGIEAIEVRQTTMNLSAPTKELERLARTGRLHHDGNPVLAWAASNVVVKEDANQNVFPRKDNDLAKIDPISATITALARATLYQEQDQVLSAHFIF